jgi:hypothetical protein
LALLPDNELSLLNENETTRTVGTVKINRNYDPNSQYDIHDILMIFRKRTSPGGDKAEQIMATIKPVSGLPLPVDSSV